MNKKLLMLVVSLGACDGTEELERATALTLSERTAEIVDNLRVAGYPDEEIQVMESGEVFVGLDAEVGLEASREMIGAADRRGELRDDAEAGFRQYRTANLVSSSVRTICVNGSAFSGTLGKALDQAIANYEALDLSFEMVRTSGSSSGCDAVIEAKLTAGDGGVAGFPSGGLPYHSINIGTTVASYGTAVATHVIQHELGHCIGFRHTDYYDRSISCGGGPTNEGDGGVGAIHIPGTPTDAVMNGSVMNSCYNGSSNGTWTASDIVALDCMYDTGSCAPEPPPSYDTSLASLSNLSGARRSQTIYGPYDATGYDALRVQMSGGSGDADLYVRFGAQPTKSTYDCRPYVSGNEEACEFNPSQDGQYWVMVYGYSAYSGLSLDVDAAGAGGPPPPPAEVCDNGVDDDGDGNADCADSDCAGDPACAGGGNCGNGVCDDGESCDGRNGTDSCPADCDGVTGGKPSNRWCEVGAGCEGPACP